MRQFTAIALGSLFAMLPCHAYSVELDLDDPLTPGKRDSEVQPPPTHNSDPTRDKLQRPVRPDAEQKTPAPKSLPNKRKPSDAPAIDPDAEQINRGAVSPR